ncbi:cytochrome C assembly family protein [Allohahella marinimesophila]|uniref:Cytochrome c biogenesis protein CcsA n=1 Tax=Allohahella marinimesophila TaxID=1054972 RepID=A0ABP7Q4V5_9GAMM
MPTTTLYSWLPAFGAISTTFYALGLALQLAVLSGKISQNRFASGLIGIAATALHGACIWIALSFSPTERTIALLDSISAIAFLSSVLIVVMAFFRPVHNLKILIYPVSAVTVIVLLFPSGAGTPGIHLGTAVIWHVGFAVLGYALMTVAALQASLVYLQHAQLKTRTNNRLIRALPPLLLMERLLIQMVTGAAIFLTLAILTGFVFADNFFAQKLLHKSVFTIAAWAVCIMLLLGRFFWGWRAKTAAVYTVSALGLLMLGFLGSKLALQYLLA